MVKNAVMMLLFLATLFLAGCAVDETPVYCLGNDECDISEYCLNDGSLTDEYGAPIGECIAALACVDGGCDTGYDCIDGYCKPTVTPPQDYDYVTDDYTPTDDHVTPTDDAPVVTDDAPVVTDDAPVVTDDAPVVTDDAPVVTDDAPVVTDDGLASDDDSLLTDEEQPDTTDSDTADTDTAPDADVDTAIFSAVFTSPGDGGKTGETLPDLIITFSHPVDEATLVYDTGGCSGTYESVITITPAIAIDSTNSSLSPDGKVLTVILLDALANNTTYTVNVPDTIQDTGGAYLDQEYNWTFSTDFTKPTAALTAPAPTTDVAVDTPIVITFTEAMNTASVVYGTSLTIVGDNGAPAVTGALAWSAGDTVLTFTPDSALENNTTYTITLTTAVADTTGNTMAQAIFTFTTLEHFVTATLTTPAAQYNVAVDTAIVVTFSEAINTATLTTSTFTITPAVAGSGAFSAGDTVYTFTPDAVLTENTEYTVAITTGIENPNGDPLDQNYEWTFKTVDAVAPTVVSTVPADAAVDVTVALSEITVLFSEPVLHVDETTVTVEETSGGAPVAGTVTLSTDGLTATFVPDAALEKLTQYTVTLNPVGVTPAIADPSDNALTGNSGDSYTFSFTTDSCGDGVKDAGETCDDGNTLEGDYCASDCSTATQPVNKVLVSYLGDINADGWTPGTTICPGFTNVSGKKCSPSNNAESSTDYTVDARKAYVFFDSDSSVVGAGFEIIRNGSVILKYPDSGSYANNTERVWVLDSNNNIGLITLRILANGIEYDSTCSADFVRISKCPTFTHGTVPATCNLEARYQGTTVPATADYPTNRIRTRFLSDEATVLNGFQMTADGTAYQTTPYNNYSNNMDQYLDITTVTPPTTVIFQNFETEVGGYGSSDYPGDYMYLYSCPLEQ